jgi:hypothetical protein
MGDSKPLLVAVSLLPNEVKKDTLSCFPFSCIERGDAEDVLELKEVIAAALV